MSDPGELVVVALRFPAVGFVVEAYVDGFELRVDAPVEWIDGRNWPLDPGVGVISTSMENELASLRVHGCGPGAVERPAAWPQSSGQLSVPMGWPGRCTAVVEHGAAVSRYQVRLSDEAVTRWAGLEGCTAALGFSVGGRLVQLVVEAPTVAPVRTELVFDSGRYQAVLHDGRLSLDRDAWGDAEWTADPERNLTAARQNAWLSLAPGGVVTSLYVRDVMEADAVAFDRTAPTVEAMRCWLPWPVEVRADRWPDGDRICVAVAFGGGDVARWQRLASSQVWVGAGEEGVLRILVLGDAEEAPPGWLEGAELDDWSEDPAEMPRLTRWVAAAPKLRFDLYSLAGELASSVGGGSGRGGVPSHLELAFGNGDDQRLVTVRSSRDGLVEARHRLSGRMYHDLHQATLVDDWQPLMIAVDGAPVEFQARRGDDEWLALARLGDTTVSVSARGGDLSDVRLESGADLAAHVEHARDHERRRIDRLLTSEGKRRAEQRRRISPEDRERRIAAHQVDSNLMRAIMRRPHAPELGTLFTADVVKPWGGAERYQRMLWLHTMLRPVVGWGASGPYSPTGDDGSWVMRITLTHAPRASDPDHTSGGFVVLRSTSQRIPLGPVDPAAIRRDGVHELDLRIVNQDGLWLADTDLLAILIERLGPLDQVVKPMSEQL